jgi:cytochrome c553
VHIIYYCRRMHDTTGIRKPILAIVLLGLMAGTTLAAERPDWAFFVPSGKPPTANAATAADARAAPWRPVGSRRSYTPSQVQDPLNPPDWYPEEHPPMPQIVAHGSPPGPSGPPLLPCALCHLPNGSGHVESASLAGLSASYIVQQFADFRSGARRVSVGNPDAIALLTAMKKGYTDAQIRAAAQYFASLKPRTWIRIVETTTVRKSIVSPETLMRTAIPSGGTEPLGPRIVELPVTTNGLINRDSHSGFIAYVPPGSVAAGKALVTTSAVQGMLPCAGCHGARLTGMGDIPPLAGRPPNYIVRQLWGFQSGERHGPLAPLMQLVTAKWTSADMLAVAAYLASCQPE